MEQKNWYHWFSSMVKEFVLEHQKQSYFEVVNVYECSKTGFTKAVIKLSERHVVEKNISDVIVDNDFIERFDAKTIRALTYMATVERLKPDYSIVVQKMSNEIEDYILELKAKNSNEKLVKTSSEISKDKTLISKLNPIEAHRIGYMSGVHQTVKEYQLIKNRDQK